MYKALMDALIDAAERDFDEAARVLGPAMDRLSNASLAELDWTSHLPPELFDSREALLVMKDLRSRLRSCSADTSLSHEERVRCGTEILAESESAVGRPVTVHCLSWLSWVYMLAGDSQRSLEFLRKSASVARETNYAVMLCQTLGSLGGAYESRGHVDSMRACWDEALTVALRYRIPVQAARISAFYARHYEREGRLSLAREMFTRSRSLCREYKGGSNELRFLVAAMDFEMNLGAWDTVEDLLKRADVVSRLEPADDARQGFIDQKMVIEARLLAARGRIEEADSLFAVTAELIRGWQKLGYYPQHLARWADALLDAGRADRALGIIHDAQDHIAGKPLEDQEAHLWFLEGRAHALRGELPAVAECMAKFDALYRRMQTKPLRREWVLSQAIRARALIGAGRLGDATAAAITSLSRLEDAVSETKASTQGYLWLWECEPLRHVLLALTSADPVLSYGVELYWRRLPSRLGQPPAGERERTEFDQLEEIRRIGAVAAERMREVGATHIVYAMAPSRCLRWTNDRGDVHLDTLSASPNQLRELARETWQVFSRRSRDPRASVPFPREQLRQLGGALLPGNLGAGRERALVLVSAHDFLDLIPFGALDVGARGTYRPLIDVADVASVLGVRSEMETPRSAPGMIAAVSTPTTTHRTLFPTQSALGNVIPEARAIAALNPDATLLIDADATKPAIVSGLQRARFVYFATHVVRHPEASYLTMIPVAHPPDGASFKDAFLELTDVRAVDMSGCRLVVLSGCSTGAPYVSTGTIGSSLGDAFLDSGSRAVVQTFWDVGDEDARTAMTRFAQDWGDDTLGHVRALGRVRRSCFREGGNPPIDWASYSIKINL